VLLLCATSFKYCCARSLVLACGFPVPIINDSNRYPQAILYILAFKKCFNLVENTNIYNTTRYINLLLFCSQNPLRFAYVHVRFQNFSGGCTPDPFKQRKGREGRGEGGWEAGREGGREGGGKGGETGRGMGREGGSGGGEGREGKGDVCIQPSIRGDQRRCMNKVDGLSRLGVTSRSGIPELVKIFTGFRTSTLYSIRTCWRSNAVRLRKRLPAS
jgi:hypothetical protein